MAPQSADAAGAAGQHLRRRWHRIVSEFVTLLFAQPFAQSFPQPISFAESFTRSVSVSVSQSESLSKPLSELFGVFMLGWQSLTFDDVVITWREFGL